MADLTHIEENYQRIRSEVPDHVTIVLAAKNRTPEEIKATIDAGATDFGENYVQEATAVREALGDAAAPVTWHMIGHLQTNKINKALPLFDVIQTVDSLEKAQAIDRRIEGSGKERISIFLEINIADEEAKRGIRPGAHQSFEEHMDSLVRGISELHHIKLNGLMTMGPWCEDPEDLRPFFKKTKALFDAIKAQQVPNVDLKHLSMGMTDSYPVAIEEGASMIRVGTAVFGHRPGKQRKG